MKPRLLAALLFAVVALAAAIFVVRGRSTATSGEASPAEVRANASSDTPAASSVAVAKESRYPHATRDPAKREELRRRLVAALAEAEAAAKASADAGAPGSAPATSAAENAARGNRETNDIEELGRFIAQAIREDFIPMARECAKDLRARQPDAGGSALVAFELLGDKKIGGVVSSAEVVASESTIHDTTFETCVRESLYGVYFDPPPAGGRATLRFPVTLTEGDAGIDEGVDDFHLKDKR